MYSHPLISHFLQPTHPNYSVSFLSILASLFTTSAIDVFSFLSSFNTFSTWFLICSLLASLYSKPSPHNLQTKGLLVHMPLMCPSICRMISCSVQKHLPHILQSIPVFSILVSVCSVFMCLFKVFPDMKDDSHLSHL